MSQGGQENRGTGPRDVFDILVKAPPERLLSLTFHLSESPEDNVIHALCLIVLQREVQALNKLQTQGNSYLARHLAEKWQLSKGKLEDFALHCGNFKEFTWESLVLLARIFKVLSEQRLCDPPQRNLAYKRALSSDNHEINDLAYEQLREEAKVVCGPEFAELKSPRLDLTSEPFRDLHGSLGEGRPTLRVSVSQDRPERAQTLLSPPKESSSMLSYPTHLEISIPPTALFEDDKTPETSDTSDLQTSILLVNECAANNASGRSQTYVEPQHKSSECSAFISRKHSTTDDRIAAESIKVDSLTSLTQTIHPTTEKNVALPSATNIVPPKMLDTSETDESSSTEEEEATFYAFVILHAPEDGDMAESMREKLEKIIGSEGATFSDDFATPGKSTLRCVEDAINNSAFTLLLLTRNFSTHMLDLETDSALVNSLNKRHKYNTVIPLLPRDNCMPRHSMPLVLQTIIPLEENRSFEKKILKSLTPARIKKQQRIWLEEQKVKIQIEKQERLKQHQKQLLQEFERVQLPDKENLRLLMAHKLLLGSSLLPEQDGEDGRAWRQQQPNIHIENAKYIMIGNDSQMTVDLGGGTDKDDSLKREEEE